MEELSREQLHDLAVKIAKFLDGWEVEPFDPDPNNYARPAIARADGACIKIRTGCDVGEGRIEVYGEYPRYNKYTVSDQNEPNDITATISRGPKAIAKDIQRRFIPEYLASYQRRLEKRELLEAEAKQRLDALDRVAVAAGAKTSERHGDIKCDLGSYGDKGGYGEATVSSIGNPTIDVEFSKLPVDLAVKIVKLWKEYQGDEGTPHDSLAGALGLLANFSLHYKEVFEEAREIANNVSDDEEYNDVQVGRCALLIAAEDFVPLSDSVRDLLDELNKRGL